MRSKPPMHRIHIRLEKSDYEWLTREIGSERLIAQTVRILIKSLREKRERMNGRTPSMKDLMDGSEELRS